MAALPQNARTLVARVKDLVTLPDLYLQLRRLMADPDTTLSEIAELVSCDPAATARLLRFANSAMLGLTRRVDTITKAVNVLGTQLVHDVVMAVSITRSFSALPVGLLNLHRFWANSVFCGLVARGLAQRCRVLDNERVFVEGLLRDIGHLVMYQEIPEVAVQALRQSAERGVPVHLLERELLGYDFASVGAELMTAWALPEALANVTRNHLEPARADDFRLETNLVYLAGTLTACHETGRPVGAWQLPDAVTRVWLSLGLAPGELEPLVMEAGQGVAEARDMFIAAAAA